MGQRHSRANRLTALATVVFSYAFLVVNIYPRVQWGSENYYMPNDVYEHGWPVSFMSRKVVANPDMGSVYYPPWPFGRYWPFNKGFGNPPLLRFTFKWLVFDVLAGMMLLTLSVCTIHTVSKRLQLRLQFSMRQLFVCMTIACLCLAISPFLPVEYAIVGLLHLLPNCLVMLSLFLGAAQIVRVLQSILQLRRPARHGRKAESPSA